MFKIVVVGYGEMFANLVTGCIQSGHKVVGVLRHSRVLYSPINLFFKDILNPDKDKSFIDSYKLNEIKAESVNSDRFYNEILKLNPDIILVGSWSEKLTKKIINLPKIACINCHPSLLPQYRGPNPYAQVIKNGETKTGVTFHLMDENFDTGAILHQTEIEIYPNDTGKTLQLRCCNQAKEEIQKFLQNLNNEIIIPIEQNERYASYQNQIDVNDVTIDLTKTSLEIDRHLRAMTSWNKCYFPHKNKFFTISNYEIIDNNTDITTPATVVKKDKNSIYITCADNKIIIFNNLKLIDSCFLYETSWYIKHKVNIEDKCK